MADDGDRRPCRVCGRKFAPDVLARHQPICKNVSKPRKVFDSSKQRATADLSVREIKQAQKKTIAPAKSHWREKHQDFINAVRSSKGVTQALQTGGPLPPPPPPSINPDYVQCPYCSRRFNEKAAERHIEFCKTQAMRLPKGKPDPAAKAKQNSRLNYQAPKLKPKTTSQPTTPAGRGGATGRGAGMTGSRGGAAAPRGRAGGVPSGRYAQEDDFSQGMYHVELTDPAFDPSPVTSSRSNQSNSYSRGRHQPTKHQAPSRTHNLSSSTKPTSTTTQQQYTNKKSRNPASTTQKMSSSKPAVFNANNYADDDDYAYDGYVDSYRDSAGSSDSGNNNNNSSNNYSHFPDHFNKRYTTSNPASGTLSPYTKNKPPTHFQYLNNVDAGGGIYDDDHEDSSLYHHDANTDSPPPASLYGNSSPASRQTKKTSPSSYNNSNPNSRNANKGFNTDGQAGGRPTRVVFSYCQDCGAKYPMPEAKFCCECGVKRPGDGKTGGGYSRLRH